MAPISAAPYKRTRGRLLRRNWQVKIIELFRTVFHAPGAHPMTHENPDPYAFRSLSVSLSLSAVASCVKADSESDTDRDVLGCRSIFGIERNI